MSWTGSQPLRYQRGFTLIELMVTVTLIAALLGLGVPSFRQFMDTQRVKSAAFDVAAALLMTRSEAIKRNKSITLAPVGGAWENGWTVKDGATTLLKQDAVGVTIEGPLPSLEFNAVGRVAATTTFELTGSTAVRCVTIDLTGIPSTRSAAC
ncbi:GspH/FimT family pseudopilin [Ramlibacter sp.]|uniref:GspH/FimT family pseudopilin n=1 Tax=Ramlibacter sp. TaxID=1917967 RepID=UPI002FC70FE8